MLDSPCFRAGLCDTLAPLERARGLPPAAYFHPAVFDFEQERVLQPAWLLACRSDDVPNTGSWLLAPVGAAGAIVLRGSDSEVRAFHNACPHRGTPLFEHGSGRCREVVCPYHGWAFSLEGELRATPTDAGWRAPPCSVDLRPMAIEELRGLLFASRARRPASFQPLLRDLPEPLRRLSLSRLVRAFRSEYEVAANWKLIAENFLESHHFPSIHPELEALTPWRKSSSSQRGGWLSGVMDIAGGAETVSPGGGRGGRPLLEGAPGAAGPLDARRVYDAYCWPLLLTSQHPDYLLTYQLQPTEPARTAITFDIYVHPGALSAGVEHEPMVTLWATLNEQDATICERQQRAMPGARRHVFMPSEDGVHAFERLVAAAYLRALGHDDLLRSHGVSQALLDWLPTRRGSTADADDEGASSWHG